MSACRAWPDQLINRCLISGKSAGVVATPQNQIVGLGNDYQFFLFLHERPPLIDERQAENTGCQNRSVRFSNFDPPLAGKGKAVKLLRGKFSTDGNQHWRSGPPGG